MSSPKSKSTFQLNVSAEIVKDDEPKAPSKNVTTDQRPAVDDDMNCRPNFATVLNILTVLLEKSNKNAVHENEICKSAKIVCPNWKATDEEMEKHIRTMLEEGQLRYKCFYDGDGCWKIGGANNPINETIYNLAQSLAQTLYSMADTLAQKSEVESQQNQVTKEELSGNLNNKVDVVDRQQNYRRIDDDKKPSVHDSVVLVVSTETSRSSLSDDGETKSEKIEARFIRNRRFVENWNEKENVENRSKIYLCSHCNEKFARKRLCRAGLSSREICILIQEILKRDEDRYGGIHCFCDLCLGVAKGEMENCRKKCRVVRNPSQQEMNICENNVKMIAEYLSKKYKK